MRLAVALPSWVGDAVMATPTLRALRTRFPDARIVAVVRPYVRPVMDPNPWTDAFIEADKSAVELLRAASRLRKEVIDIGVLLPNSFRSALLFRLAGVKRRIGYDRGGRGALLTDRVQPEKKGGRFVPTPQIAYYLRLAEVLGAPTGDCRMELFPTEADEAAAEVAYRAAGLTPERTLLLCPGAAFGPSKRWPPVHWGTLVREARARFGLDSAILCAPSDADLATTIIESAGGHCATFHDKGINLASARAVVRRARAMVAIDSGLRHYAVALGRPVVSLFGPTDVRWTETWHEKEVRLQAVPPCGPCQRPTCPVGTTECMWKIEPEEVLDALAEALERDRA